MQKISLYSLLFIAAILIISCENPVNQPGVSSNADLESLYVSWGELDPPFSKDIFEYSIEVPIDLDEITINGITEQNSASINGSGSFTLQEGSNVFNLTVTAQDGSHLKTFTIDVIRTNHFHSPTIGWLRYVPTGSFQRDSFPANISHIVSEYRMAECEISRAQYLEIMESDPTYEENSGGMDSPVGTLGFYRTLAFCNKLSIHEGLDPVYTVIDSETGLPIDFNTLEHSEIPYGVNKPVGADDWESVTADWSANGYRLPTVMEWTWAAMGGVPAPYNKAFSGSNGLNQIEDYAWYAMNSNDSTHNIGTKLPNELGIFDLTGNAGEWCWDKDDDYPDGNLYSNTEAGRGPGTEFNRVMMLSTFGSMENSSYIDERFSMISYRHYNGVGIRVIRN